MALHSVIDADTVRPCVRHIDAYQGLDAQAVHPILPCCIIVGPILARHACAMRYAACLHTVCDTVHGLYMMHRISDLATHTTLGDSMECSMVNTKSSPIRACLQPDQGSLLPATSCTCWFEALVSPDVVRGVIRGARHGVLPDDRHRLIDMYLMRQTSRVCQSNTT